MSTPTEQLVDAGVSIWLDDLSRDRIKSGNLAHLIETRNVTGVTTNPTIFATAIADGEQYGPQLTQLTAKKAGINHTITELITTDVRDAATALRPVFDATKGVDGRVSVEVSPELAHDTIGTIAQARQLWQTIDRPNVLIKIPATKAGLLAITEVIAAGISVNVTLIFGLPQYQTVIDAYLTGLEKAHAAGLDLGAIHSVASFFVSRVDSEVDARLDALSAEAASVPRFRAGVSNALLAYELYKSEFSTPRVTRLIAAGANVQRPLWASTGVKSAAVPDTMYVTQLATPGAVNTMPEKTLEALFDHGVVGVAPSEAEYVEARAYLALLDDVGVDFADVTESLEREGIDKFLDSWRELVRIVSRARRL